MNDFDFFPSRDALHPMELPVLPSPDVVLFPQILTPLIVAAPASLEAVEAATRASGDLIVVAQHNPQTDQPTPDDVYTIGVRAAVVRHLRLPDGAFSVLLQGYERVEIVRWLQIAPYPIALARPFITPEEEEELSLVTEAQMRAALALFEKYTTLHPHVPEDAFIAASNVSAPGWLADLIASVLEVNLDLRQEILETADPILRLQRLTTILARELDVLELEDRIQNQVQQEVDRSQREYFLREQIRVMQSELGETDGIQAEINELRQRIESMTLPVEVRQKAEKELNRLSNIPPMAPEVGIIRTYLDWIVDLPWSEMTEDNLDLNHAEAVLDKNHYGLTRVKERILEYIAVKARTGDDGKLRSPILCFVGPPGTGKTSLGKSIAEALGRKFARLSLGGVRDEAEIRGHRRTYIGAMPGRIIQTMKRVGTLNPLFMLDEVDKLGMDYRGDPTAALLEVLDPEQNNTFSDHYLDLPYDLSKVLFITTANLTDTIPPPLLDRMEIIEFPGYIDQEKIAIARQFLIPRHLEEHGLSPDELTFTDAALQRIIRAYTYEAGVRNLDREIGRICRKVVRRLVQGKRTPRTITPAAAGKYLGPPRFTESILDEEDEVGVATGLAWTAAGGDILSIEVSLYEGKGNLTLTGQLGEVMQESVQAALSYTKANAARYGIDPARFETTDIHLHVPEGATPKDGPSAGIPVTVALISAFSGRKVRRDIAMTGEVTLRGKVLAVGGLRAKAMAARRVGIKTIIIPRQNQKDLVEIPPRVRRHLHFVPVDRLEEALNLALV
ncbi:MAG: endopeptidase La [Caldilineae bacterium]|nr:MAG: endopeptidase La [Caldilineae bacterium]